MDEQKVYFDFAATTPVDPRVMDAMLPYFIDDFGNPSSVHTYGQRAEAALENSRENVARILGCRSNEIIFTSCGSESDNLAIRGTAMAARQKRHANHILISPVEHHAVSRTAQQLAELDNFEVEFLPVDSYGMVYPEIVAERIRSDTALVSIIYANNEIGTINPVSEIGAICRSAGIPFHTDAVQASGKIAVNVKKLPCDMMSISGHKMHASKGVAALYIKRGTPFSPYIIGGHQEKGRRAGTENVASIVGFGIACDLANKHLQTESTKVKDLRDRLEQGLLNTCPDPRINGDRANRLPNTTNISFAYVEGEAILLRLNEFNICASSGSACTSGSLEPSHVLRSMGVPFTAIHGSVRFSLSRYTTEEEVDFVLEKMPPIIKELRELSPYGVDPACH